MKLKLVLKKEWFDMILSGEKKEEYRDISEFYIPRIIELTSPLSIQGINKITGLFCYYWGMMGNKYKGLDCLFGHEQVNYRKYESVIFYMGYSKNRPSFEIELKYIHTGFGVEKWGAEPIKTYFVLKLGKIITC